MISQPIPIRAKVLFLALVFVFAAAVFHPVGGYAFLNWDDDIYLENNPHLRKGLTVESVEWALNANLGEFSQHAEYWAPITLLTRIMDAQAFGISAGPMHVTSVVLHALNAVLLALALHSLTGAWWRSAVVALLFLVHPQNVEPALWLSARKDVVAATFLFLTLLAYARYVRKPGKGTYAVVMLAFIGALMAKPMAVSVPVLLLLLDFWPLNRLKDRATSIRIFAEKLPLFMLAAVAALLAVLAQQDVGAMGSYPWGVRISNAIYALAMYVKRTVWPDDLCIFYPHTEGSLSWGVIAGCAAVPVLLTAFAVWQFRKRPVVMVGWLWFLAGLAPVIGLVQVGRQAMADRYFYTTGIGLFIAVVWLVAELVRSSVAKRGMAVCAVVLLAAASVFQVRSWKDSEAAFSRAVAVTNRNYVAHGNLGSHYFVKGRMPEAKAEFLESLSVNPYQFTAWNNLGAVEAALGRNAAAVHAYGRAVLLDQKSAKAQFNFAKVLAKEGRKEEAITALKRAVELAPKWPEPAKLLGELVGGEATP